MSTVDTMDIPPTISTETAVTASEPAAKRKKSNDTSREQFCERIRSATGWFNTMTAGTWKNVTSEKMRRTLFVLQVPNGGGEQFCCVGKVFNARLSRQELQMPLPFDTNDEHTELSVALGLRSLPSNEYWTNYEQDIGEEAAAFTNLRKKAIDEAFAPLFASKPEKVPGVPDSRLKRGFGKTKKEIATSLESMWQGTGMNAEGDLVRFRRKCWNFNDLADSGTFMKKWLAVADERGDPLNYIDEHESIRTGDTVLVWYRVLAQACAGNFHVSLEPRQIMRLGRGADGMSKGSAGLAAALAQALDRGDEI